MHLRYDGIEHVFVPDSRLRRTGKLTVNMSDDLLSVGLGVVTLYEHQRLATNANGQAVCSCGWAGDFFIDHLT